MDPSGKVTAHVCDPVLLGNAASPTTPFPLPLYCRPKHEVPEIITFKPGCLHRSKNEKQHPFVPSVAAVANDDDAVVANDDDDDDDDDTDLDVDVHSHVSLTSKGD